MVGIIIAHTVERSYIEQRPRKIQLNEYHVATHIQIFQGISCLQINHIVEISVYIYVCICVYVCMCVCVCVYIYIYIYIYKGLINRWTALHHNNLDTRKIRKLKTWTYSYIRIKIDNKCNFHDPKMKTKLSGRVNVCGPEY